MGERSGQEFATPIHSSLIRPQLIMGCDRELFLGLVMFVCLIAGPLGVMDGNFYALPVAALVWFIGRTALVKMSKIDPYARHIFMASMRYLQWYPAVAYAAETEEYKTVNGAVKAKSCAGLLPYGALVYPCIMFLKDGTFLACFEFVGEDLTTATDRQKYITALRTSRALSQLGSNYCIHFETIRVPAPAYPSGSFSQVVTYVIDAERRRKHEIDGAHFETKLFCFIKWCPEDKLDKTLNSIKGTFEKLKRLARKEKPEELEDTTSVRDDLETFKHVIEGLVNSFSVIYNVNVLNDEELLNAVSLCVSGKDINKPMPEVPWMLDSLLAVDIENSDPFMVNGEFVKIIAVSGFPSYSIPSMLIWLGQLPFEYRWSTRFIPKDFQEAYGIVDKERKKWEQKIYPMLPQLLGRPITKIDKDAQEQAEDAAEAQADLQRGNGNLGNYTSCVIVRDVNYRRLEEKVRLIEKTIQENLFTVRVETRNSLEAFLGSLPGDHIRNVRKPVVNTMNLADFLMLSSAWPGLKYNPCAFYPPNSPCLMQVSSSGNNPFRFNIHVSDIGHTLILGPTGSGKSTLLATIVAQFDRYKNSQVFAFDKGKSLYPLISAMDNASFYELGSDDDTVSSPDLCPLSSLETASDIAWAANYIENLVQLNDCAMSPSKRREISETLTAMAEGTTSSDQRSLTDFQINLQNEELKDALQPFVSGGPYGKFLDGTKTNIKYSRYTCFEIEGLMNLSEKVVTSVLLYLFHEIEKRLDGRPSLIVIDECWVALANKLFSAQLAEWLRVLRKSNCAVIMATQSLSQILQSDIAKDILESTKTRIMLANPDANSEGMKPLYIQQLSLTEAETDAIATAIPKREYFYISPLGKRKFSLNLGPVQLSFVGAAGKEDLKKVTKYKAMYGQKWPAYYLSEERNLPDWGKYYMSLYDKNKKK